MKTCSAKGQRYGAIVCFVLFAFANYVMFSITRTQNQNHRVEVPSLTPIANCGYVYGNHIMEGHASMGNKLWMLISIMGIALRNGRIPAIPNTYDLKLEEYLNLPEIFATINNSNDRVIGEMGPARFTPALLNIPCDGTTVYAPRYLQNFKYIEGFEDTIRRQFSIKQDTLNQCQNALNEELAARNLSRPDIKLFGMHCRRGDFVNSSHGHLPISEKFIHKAITYVKGWMDHKEPVNKNKTYFLAVGNDLEWLRTAANDIPTAIVPQIARDRFIDHCMLIQCDGIITMSGSSFGITAAFLQNKSDVFYSSEYCVEGSNHCNDFDPHASGHLLPQWTAV